MQAPNAQKKGLLFKRLERLRGLQGITWSQVAQKLGVSVPMLMLVKSGRRNLSEKVLARLEWAEVEAGLKPSSTLSEEARAVGNRKQSRDQVVTESDIEKGYFDFHPEFRAKINRPSGSEPIRLIRPESDGRTRLGMILATSFESEIVVLACLPDELRNQAFMETLTLSSRNALHDAAMTLVFGNEWRATVARLAIESRIGDRTEIDQILGRGASSQS
jgi:transcriptional regulator with XRE-family HTH domain